MDPSHREESDFLSQTSDTPSQKEAPPSLYPWPVLIIGLAALCLVSPFFFMGNPSGHDFEFHVNSWMEVLYQWQHGVLYPRWAGFSHYLYGEARFIFYPPISWTVGAAIGAILPWKAAPGAYVFLAALLSGVSMFLLARTFLQRNDAIFAAVLYALNPYVVVVVYWRSAFAELLAGALLPLLLLWAMRIPQRGRQAVIPLSMIVAAAWLTNAPSAVMVNYSLALMILVLAIVYKSPRVLLYGALAALLGAALAAFYVVPAAHEVKWVNIAEVLAPGVRPQDNFLFATIDDNDHNRFNLLVSVVAIAEIVALGGAALLSNSMRKKMPAQWCTLMAWAVAALLLMLSFTLVAWEHLPKLRFVQLPWRWLLCLNVPLALLVASSFRRWFMRTLLCLALLSTLWMLWHRVQPPWWDQEADIREMHENIVAGPGYEGTDEYVPAGADPYEIDQKARRVTLDGNGQAQIHILQWDPETKRFSVQLTQPAKVALRLFNYPAWQVEVNGIVVPAETREVTGQMVLPLSTGQNEVKVEFRRTWDRLAGTIVSILAFLSIVTLMCTRPSLRFALAAKRKP